MLKRIVFAVSVMALAAVLGACATSGGGSTAGVSEIRSGVIEHLSDVQIGSNHHTGVGAVVGGLVGLGVGSLIGGGSGRDVAQVLGTVGGAVAGNAVQKKHDQPVAGQQIVVRMSNGVLVSVTQPTTSGLQVGQKVYIQGSGENARVIPQ